MKLLKPTLNALLTAALLGASLGAMAHGDEDHTVKVDRTRAGRVLLAALPEPELSAWLEGRVLARLTPYTVTDPGALRQILEQIRQQDCCIASEEHEIGVHAVAVPLRNLQGKTVGALNAVLTPARLARGAIQRELLPLLQDAARELRALL